jgi:hypothetical protein
VRLFIYSSLLCSISCCVLRWQRCIYLLDVILVLSAVVAIVLCNGALRFQCFVTYVWSMKSSTNATGHSGAILWTAVDADCFFIWPWTNCTRTFFQNVGELLDYTVSHLRRLYALHISFCSHFCFVLHIGDFRKHPSTKIIDVYLLIIILDGSPTHPDLRNIITPTRPSCHRGLTVMRLNVTLTAGWMCLVLLSISFMPVTVAARWKARTVFVRVGSNPTQGMDVCVRLFCVCVVLCVGSGLATGWSLVQGVRPTVYGLRNWKKWPRPKRVLEP